MLTWKEGNLNAERGGGVEMEMDWNDVPKAERYLGTTDEWR